MNAGSDVTPHSQNNFFSCIISFITDERNITLPSAAFPTCYTRSLDPRRPTKHCDGFSVQPGCHDDSVIKTMTLASSFTAQNHTSSCNSITVLSLPCFLVPTCHPDGWMELVVQVFPSVDSLLKTKHQDYYCATVRGEIGI